MSTVTPNTFVYVVKLRGPDFAEPTRLSGRIEHVMSGRRHDFDNGAALLACLRHEQEQALIDADDEPGPRPPGRPRSVRSRSRAGAGNDSSTRPRKDP